MAVFIKRFKHSKILVLAIIVVCIVLFVRHASYLLTENNESNLSYEEANILVPENIEIIMKTLEFIRNKTEQDDQELIEFVRTLIKPPSKLPINLTDKTRKDFSQTGQSLIIDNVLQAKKNGFFIEAGGWDGEEFSNTLFFELERNWTGLLIEPVTEMYNEIVKRQRNIYAINACIAHSRPYIAKIRVAGYLSGIEDEMSDDHKKRVNNEKQKNKFSNEGKYIYVPCFSLYTILNAIKVVTVDFFSLDIEGGEWNVIKSLPYEKIEFKTFVIEYTANQDTYGLIKTRLAENGFRLLKQDNQDLFYVHKQYQITS